MILDAFHGAGGWAEGLRLLGLHSLGVEIDPDMVATSRAAGHQVVLADVAKIDPRALVPAGERCVGVIMSAPCPSFSAGGKQLGRKDLPQIHRIVGELAQGVDLRAGARWHDERSALTCEPMRWAYLLRPDWVALEQVPAVLPVWENMAARLRELGYSAWTGLVYAERYGVPQTRKRAVLLASRLREVGEPSATHRRYYPPATKLAAEPPDAHLPRWVSMAEALGWGMTERPCMSVTSGGTYTGGAEIFGSGARQGIEREREAGRWRQVPDVDWRAVRVSIEEAGVLQSFSPNYPWRGTKTKQFMQVGNAVPVLLARACLAEVIGLPNESVSNGRINLAALGVEVAHVVQEDQG